MKINKIINNNVVSALDHNGKEVIVMRRGIAFQEKAGNTIDDQKIERIFYLRDQMNNKLIQLVDSIPSDYIALASDIIDYARIYLHRELDDSIYISLSDHIYTAIERINKGITMRCSILWDIKRFYEKEYAVAQKALEMIKSRFDIALPEDETGFIALHFVNAEMDTGSLEQVMEITEIMQEITRIVQYFFNMEFDTDSLYYYRFITHLKFFAERFVKHTMLEDQGENQLFKMIRQEYVNSYRCVQKISEFLSGKYGCALSEEEQLYLIIHIERIVHKTNN